jgi:hypothetical protein
VTFLRDENAGMQVMIDHLRHSNRKVRKSATPFTAEEVRQLNMAFHPDANLSAEKRTELFKLWNSKVA